ncbi:MAG: DUF1329 domain-containing protein, partial [Gammaproteobacteria bacterium]
MNKLILLSLLFSLAGSSVFAKVTQEEAEMLGNSLTPLGAEKAGNAAGTIPQWEGGLNSLNTTKSKDIGRPDNPFPDDQPLFVINNSNFGKHQHNLSPGQIALFNKYPSYQMPVYQTKRTAAYPPNLYSVIKENAITSELLPEGGGVKNYQVAIPFPIPSSAIEVLWNHVTRF